MRVVGPPVVLSDLTTAAAFVSLATLLFLPALVTVFGRWLPLAPQRKQVKPPQN